MSGQKFEFEFTVVSGYDSSIERETVELIEEIVNSTEGVMVTDVSKQDDGGARFTVTSATVSGSVAATHTVDDVLRSIVETKGLEKPGGLTMDSEISEFVVRYGSAVEQ